MDRALAIAAEADHQKDASLVEVVRAYREGGCAGLLASTHLEAETRKDEYVGLLATECAFLADDEELATRYIEERTRVRRALALDEGKKGREAENSGNVSRAIRHFRRSVAANPGHGPSAAALARILSDRGDREAATEILRAAQAASEGLPQSASAITGAAESLDIDL
jgi:tetratricopeptide (TPR) repeat protein